MFVEVTTAYTAQYPDPICFDAGVEVEVGRCDPESPGWFWCRAPSGKEGWVHHSFLAASAGTTTSLRAYTARELTVAVGERGTLIRSLDGWLYIRLDAGGEGWIPQSYATLNSE
jgi:SH3-like domain-containing protein